MQWENDRHQFRDQATGLRCVAQIALVIDIARTMQRDHGVVGWEVEAARQRFKPHASLREKLEQGVDHDVADEVDPLTLDPLGDQVLVGIWARSEQPLRQSIGEDAVDLLRHRPIPDRNPASTCATGIPTLDAASVAPRVALTSPTTTTMSAGVPYEMAFEPDEHASGLFGMSPGSDPELDIRRAHMQIFEEGSGHEFVVVLTGVYQLGGALTAVERGEQWSHLDEVRSSGNYAGDPRWRHRLVRSGSPSTKSRYHDVRSHFSDSRCSLRSAQNGRSSVPERSSTFWRNSAGRSRPNSNVKP